MSKVKQEQIIKTIELLKKDNSQNFKKAKKEGVMVNWDIERVKTLVDTYLNSVLRLLNIKEKPDDKSK